MSVFNFFNKQKESGNAMTVSMPVDEPERLDETVAEAQKPSVRVTPEQRDKQNQG